MGALGYQQGSISETRNLLQSTCIIKDPQGPSGPRSPGVGGGRPTLDNCGGSSGQHFEMKTRTALVVDGCRAVAHTGWGYLWLTGGGKEFSKIDTQEFQKL